MTILEAEPDEDRYQLAAMETATPLQPPSPGAMRMARHRARRKQGLRSFGAGPIRGVGCPNRSARRAPSSATLKERE
jgi:hypothetical protein